MTFDLIKKSGSGYPSAAAFHLTCRAVNGVGSVRSHWAGMEIRQENRRHCGRSGNVVPGAIAGVCRERWLVVEVVAGAGGVRQLRRGSAEWMVGVRVVIGDRATRQMQKYGCSKEEGCSMYRKM